MDLHDLTSYNHSDVHLDSMTRGNCSRMKDTWWTVEQQSTVWFPLPGHDFPEHTEYHVQHSKGPSKRQYCSHPKSPCQHNTFNCSGSMKEYNRTWRPWPNVPPEVRLKSCILYRVSTNQKYDNKPFTALAYSTHFVPVSVIATEYQRSPLVGIP